MIVPDYGGGTSIYYPSREIRSGYPPVGGDLWEFGGGGGTPGLFGGGGTGGIIGDIIEIGGQIIQGSNGDPCPPGTACSGPSAAGICLGACRSIIGGGGENIQCPSGTYYDPNQGRCVQSGQPFGPIVQDGGRVAAPSCPSPSCTLPTGRRGRLNKSRYYRFGDCRRGTSPGVVNPGTVCTTPRRTNFGNDKAAMRAARRLNGAVRHYKKMIDSVAGVRAARTYKGKK